MKDRQSTPNGQIWSSIQSWRGYKLHLDVIDGDIPISAILSSASMHDSQAAIPLAQISACLRRVLRGRQAERVTSLYDLADAAYAKVDHVALPHGKAAKKTASKAGNEAVCRKTAFFKG